MDKFGGNLLHLLKDLRLEGIFFMRIGLVQVPLEVGIRNFVASLIFSIILRLLLNRIIGQVHKLV